MTLSRRDLWVIAVATVVFLKTLPPFSHLATTEPPAPRPQRESCAIGHTRAISFFAMILYLLASSMCALQPRGRPNRCVTQCVR